MRTKSWFAGAVTLGAVAGAGSMPPAQADDGFRCQRTKRLVSVGDRLSEVRAKCGQADFADNHVEKRKIKRRLRDDQGRFDESLTEEREIEIVIDNWTYDFGKSFLMRHLRFENGTLAFVATGDYGSDD